MRLDRSESLAVRTVWGIVFAGFVLLTGCGCRLADTLSSSLNSLLTTDNVTNFLNSLLSSSSTT